MEINTQPGMTLIPVPEIANHKGITFENLVEKILLDASTNRWKENYFFSTFNIVNNDYFREK